MKNTPVLVLAFGLSTTTSTHAFTTTTTPTSVSVTNTRRILGRSSASFATIQDVTRRKFPMSTSTAKLIAVDFQQDESSTALKSVLESSNIDMTPNPSTLIEYNDDEHDNLNDGINHHHDSSNNGNDPVLGIWAARGLLMVIAILWGTNFAAVKYLSTLCFHPPCIHPPSEAAFARFGVAAIVSMPLLLGQKKEIILAGLECGFWITIGYVTQAIALGTYNNTYKHLHTYMINEKRAIHCLQYSFFCARIA